MKIKILLFINVILLITLIIFIFLYFNKDTSGNSKILRDQQESFALTNPILDCENANQSNNPIISRFKIIKEVESLEETYNVNSISMYYRDLNDGPWIGINEDEIFSPASLLKTPVAMALFKYAEDNPDILNKKVLITEDDSNAQFNQNIIFPGALEKGKEYSMLEAVESMIIRSDNIAVSVILKNIPESYIDGVFKSIGVPYKDVRNEVNLRVKDSAAFFRVLFNSSYLSREMSEKLLQMLSKSLYTGGLSSYTGEGVVVSHKFGERVIGSVYQLHDCGIVYYPNNPYLLCIMTKGDNFLKLQGVLKNLSKFVYQEVDKSIKGQ